MHPHFRPLRSLELASLLSVLTIKGMECIVTTLTRSECTPDMYQQARITLLQIHHGLSAGRRLWYVPNPLGTPSKRLNMVVIIACSNRLRA